MGPLPWTWVAFSMGRGLGPQISSANETSGWVCKTLSHQRVRLGGAWERLMGFSAQKVTMIFAGLGNWRIKHRRWGREGERKGKLFEEYCPLPCSVPQIPPPCPDTKVWFCRKATVKRILVHHGDSLPSSRMGGAAVISWAHANAIQA